MKPQPKPKNLGNYLVINMENSPLNSKNKEISDKYKNKLYSSFNYAIAFEKLSTEDPKTLNYLKERAHRVSGMGKYLFGYTICVGVLKKIVLSRWLGKGFSLPSIGYYLLCAAGGPPFAGYFVFDSDFQNQTMKFAIRNEENLLETDESLRKLYLNYMKEDISDQFKSKPSV